MFHPAETLASRPTWFLEASCRCGSLVQVPIRMLLLDMHQDRTILSVARLLRCRQCSERPIKVVLLDSITRDNAYAVDSGQGAIRLDIGLAAVRPDGGKAERLPGASTRGVMRG